MSIPVYYSSRLLGHLWYIVTRSPSVLQTDPGDCRNERGPSTLMLRLQFTERIITEGIEFNSQSSENKFLCEEYIYSIYIYMYELFNTIFTICIQYIPVSKHVFVSYLFLILFTLLNFYFLSQPHVYVLLVDVTTTSLEYFAEGYNYREKIVLVFLSRFSNAISTVEKIWASCSNYSDLSHGDPDKDACRSKNPRLQISYLSMMSRAINSFR